MWLSFASAELRLQTFYQCKISIAVKKEFHPFSSVLLNIGQHRSYCLSLVRLDQSFPPAFLYILLLPFQLNLCEQDIVVLSSLRKPLKDDPKFCGLLPNNIPFETPTLYVHVHKASTVFGDEGFRLEYELGN